MTKGLLLCVVFVYSVWSWSFTPCHIQPEHEVEYIIDESHRPENKYDLSEIPDSLDWRFKDGQRYATWTRNQHIPNYCGGMYHISNTYDMHKIIDYLSLQLAGRCQQPVLYLIEL